MSIAHTFNQFVEPENKKNAFKVFYLVGAGSTFFGVWLSIFHTIPMSGIPFIGVGALSMALGFDYRMERIEEGHDKLKEKVEE